MLGDIADKHARRPIFAESSGKGQDRAGHDALFAVGHADMPENKGVRQPQGLSTPSQCFIEAFKSPPRRAVHEGKGDDSRCQDAAVPGHDEADAGLIEKDADGMLKSKDQEQQPAADRRHLSQ